MPDVSRTLPRRRHDTARFVRAGAPAAHAALLGLQRVAQRLAAGAAGEDLLDMVLEEAVRLVGGETGTLWLWDEPRQVLVAARNTVPTAPEYRPVALGLGVGGRAALRRRVVILNDYQRESGDETPAGKTGVRAAIGAPLIADGQLLGAVTANTLDPRKHFGETDAQIFELLAGQASAVIKMARLFEAERRQRRELETARLIAEEASRLKGEFLASMSHELRTPLNSIIGYSQFMLDGLDGELTPAQRRDLGRVLANGEHLLGLINDVLDLSKIEAGQFQVYPEPTLLGEVVQGALAAVEPLARRKALRLEFSLPPGLPPVMADPDRLRQVLLNLLSNAVKFTDAGAVRVLARALDDVTEVTVSDTGPGVPPDAQQTIFERFRQLDGSSTRRHNGTGLGLAIARQLLELMGGSIRLSSTPGRGSDFIFTLPRVPVRAGGVTALRSVAV
jgi:signal transduction histidine kinase